MARAARLAQQSTCNQQHGAIIVRGGSVLGTGINMMKNNPDTPGLDPKTQSSVHAECAALKAVKGTNLKGAIVYVARINKAQQPMMSKPCPNCEAELKRRGVVKMIWTLDNSKNLV